MITFCKYAKGQYQTSVNVKIKVKKVIIINTETSLKAETYPNFFTSSKLWLLPKQLKAQHYGKRSKQTPPQPVNDLYT